MTLNRKRLLQYSSMLCLFVHGSASARYSCCNGRVDKKRLTCPSLFERCGCREGGKVLCLTMSACEKCM